MRTIRAIIVGIWVTIAAILTACGGGTAEATSIPNKVITSHFVFVDPVDGLENRTAWVVDQLVARIESETGLLIDVGSISVITSPPECLGVLFSNVSFGSRVAQLRCLRQYAVKEVTNKLDEWVHFFTPPFIVADGTRRFAGLATGIGELGTCGRINRAIKCHPVTVTNIALENSLGEYRIEHVLEATEHEFGHIMGLEHREEFACQNIAYTMHPAALAYCSPDAYKCVEDNRQSCSLYHDTSDLGRISAQLKFVRRDRTAQRKKCRKAFRKRACVNSCKKRIRFYRPQLENLKSLKTCDRQPTRGRRSNDGVNVVESFLYE